MPKSDEFYFDHKDLVETLIQKADVHKGLWQLSLQFGMTAINVGDVSTGNLNPAVICPVLKIGIHRVDQLNPLTVDAAKVNPAKPKRARKKAVAKAP